jgi:hypothetical protein
VKQSHTYPLSQVDAFFVAYQERAGILMQLGIEVDLAGTPSREALEQTLTHVTGRWPQLGRILHARMGGGLAWRGQCQIAKMLKIVPGPGGDAVFQWRNSPIDPFREPPFQLLAILDSGRSTLAFRAHHAVCDGEALITVGAAALRTLAQIMGGRNPSLEGRAAAVGLASLLSLSKQWRLGRLHGMWRHLRQLSKESGSGRSASLSMRACTPGDVSTRERTLDRSVTSPWLCAAAWARAIGAWNASRGGRSGGGVSLEIPVSLRSGRQAKTSIGNLISPLVVFADPTRPLEEISRELVRQFKAGLRRRAHLAVPLFTMPARHLPWTLFRKVAVNTASTGFATSHFTWLETKSNVYDEVPSLSGGALRLLDHHAYGPVCLHMGAALMTVHVPGSTKVCLTYRRTAFAEAEAEELLTLFLAELSSKQALHVSPVR